MEGVRGREEVEGDRGIEELIGSRPSSIPGPFFLPRYLRIQLEDRGNCVDAMEYISQLPFKDVSHSLHPCTCREECSNCCPPAPPPG